MANLIVRPSYQATETDILTVDKLNLLGTPTVTLMLETPVNDQNYFRNGNFYSAFWVNPSGVPVDSTAWVENASYWMAKTSAGQITFQRSTDVPDAFSLWSAQLVGQVGVGDVFYGQQINGDLCATLRRPCTFSGYIENNTGDVVHPTLEFWTCDSFNNFNTITLQATVDLQTCANANWTYVHATQDVSLLANVANGLFVVAVIPSGALAAAGQTVNFSRLKFQIGEIATEFTDDPSLFIQAPSVDSTMIQDGAIARPGLFLPNVIPQGAFQAGAIQTADIGDGQVTGAKLSATAVADSLGYTPVNKAGDTAIGQLGFGTETLIAATSPTQAAIQINGTSANANNNNYDPMISFNRPGQFGRTIGLAPDGRFRTVDHTGAIGYLVDTITGLDTNSYQPGSVTLQALAQSLINIIIPAGMIRMFGGPTIPAGWLVCDGTAVSRALYPALYSAIGTYWGVGDNISTFNLPDLRGRSPLGYVNTALTGITSRAFAARGGEENHVLSVAELATHNHNPIDNGHGHPGSVDTGHYHLLTDNGHHHTGVLSSAASNAGSGTSWNIPNNYGSTSTDKANITVNMGYANLSIANAPSGLTIQANGSNYGHNNMQPFAVVYFIIKT